MEKEKKGTRAPLVMSIIALLISIGAVAVAANSQLYVYEASKQINYDLGNLINESSNNAIMGTNNGGAANNNAAIPPSVNSPASEAPANSPSGPAATGTTANLTVGQLFAAAPSMVMAANDGSGAVAKAWMAVYGDNTYFRLAAIKLPAPGAGETYYGWIIDPATGTAIDAGSMNYSATTSEATLSYSGSGDLSAYRQIAVTLEKSAVTAPTGKRVLENTFPDTTVFTVTDSQIMNNGTTGSSQPQGQTMMETTPPAPASGNTSVPASSMNTTQTPTNGIESQIANNPALQALLEQSKLPAANASSQSGSAGAGTTANPSLESLMANSGASASANSQLSLSDFLKSLQSGSGSGSINSSDLSSLLGSNSAGQQAILQQLLGKSVSGK